VGFPFRVEVFTAGVVIVDDNAGVLTHPLDGDQRLGVDQDDGIYGITRQVFEAHVGQVCPVLADEAAAVAIDAARQQGDGVWVQQPGPQLGGQGIHIRLFVGQDHFHDLIKPPVRLIIEVKEIINRLRKSCDQSVALVKIQAG